MWVIFLEMGAVILIGAFIVWWTLPKKKKPEAAGKEAGKENDAR